MYVCISLYMHTHNCIYRNANVDCGCVEEVLQRVKEPHGYVSLCNVGTTCPNPKSFLWLLIKQTLTLMKMWPRGTQGRFHGVAGDRLPLSRQETWIIDSARWKRTYFYPSLPQSTIFGVISAFLIAFSSGSPFILLGRRHNRRVPAWVVPSQIMCLHPGFWVPNSVEFSRIFLIQGFLKHVLDLLGLVRRLISGCFGLRLCGLSICRACLSKP